MVVAFVSAYSLSQTTYMSSIEEAREKPPIKWLDINVNSLLCATHAYLNSRFSLRISIAQEPLVEPPGLAVRRNIYPSHFQYTLPA